MTLTQKISRMTDAAKKARLVELQTLPLLEEKEIKERMMLQLGYDEDEATDFFKQFEAEYEPVIVQ